MCGSVPKIIGYCPPSPSIKNPNTLVPSTIPVGLLPTPLIDAEEVEFIT
jgi:hypothetical protein